MIQIIKTINRQDAEQQNRQEIAIRKVGKQDQRQTSPGCIMASFT